ncbi:peroxisomal biogenesis factor 19-like isoform X2 [Ptychodera flava]|uniref:peroxisomal biogenesis factor 19-like isoform X2 n=1 Tax=Ptychodera flava TaxID=63121 RepID=UPI00396A0451
MAAHSEDTDDNLNSTDKEISPAVDDESEQSADKVEDEDAELDDLLDSALEDFDKCKPAEAEKPRNEEQVNPTSLAAEASSTNIPSQGIPESLFGDLLNPESAAAVTSEFEKAMQAMMNDMASQTPDDPGLAEQLQKLMEAAGSDLPGATGSGPDFTRTLGETMNRLAQNAEELKSDQFSEEDLLSAMDNFKLDGDSQGDFMPMMQSMMQSLLSKEVLYPSIKEIVDKYPKWLEENKDKGNPEYTRYQKQYTAMKALADEYESENSTDSEDIRKERFEKIMKIVQEMESLGQPPKELVGDMAPGLEFDEHGNPKIPGLPSPDQCVVM